ncbi:AfsR/SARP family transcriptional regulator [Paractinoplanes atraurantiacus]|uniref:DNA-binding transcriptional activator of the SARP family n=1 Tax=Paractinoplanes atraurantiacus TaxID=1036182 RepID=A0A285F011_9ACTN|nr:AfsR/SARP family transcriptional regulator [Actinoplanes atraurantiacus]SNY04627.1 DNA-binding transcriptional activator of the SARP family [Actinoplanes atraurantiacus]
MRYRILGPLSVTVDGHDVTVTAGRDRIVLAMLLLHPGRVLGVGVLAEAVWGADPPATARGQLQTCVSRLRRILPPGAIRTDPAGYRIDAGPDDLDVAAFDRLVAGARSADDPGAARRAYTQALDLWRGPSLAETESEAVRGAGVMLDERCLAATEEWAELELGAGNGPEMAVVLAGLVERYPLRERLRGQLMTALYRSGRQADALAEFRRARQVLRDDLGIEPGAELQRLHQAILAGEVPAAEKVAEEKVRCLPRTVGDFTGREATVRRLVTAIEAADDSRPVVAVIDGMAGSGKTTLALHVAALLGERYPDAHLFVDLHGHSAERPLEPAAALLVLLRQLGVAAERIPPELVDRVGMWRTELARRRVLVLFDNAASSAQLSDLLPTAPGSLALVTGRRRLIGLDGVHPESLAVLPHAEAVALLARIVGDRVDAEPEAAAEVARRCGGLPLAVRLAGSRLAHRPRWRVADLVRRLGESALPELAAEDRSVASAFAVSYSQLPDPVQRVFRLLGLCPGTEFDALAAAALSGLELDRARDVLDDLVDVNLVDEPEPGVYRMHDLLREFAAVLAAEIAPAERAEALRGVLDQQLQAVAATNLSVYREVLERDIGALTPLRPDLLEAVGDPRDRIERERTHLGAYVEAAAAVPELAGYAWRLPRAAWRHLYHRAYLDDVHSLHEQALAVLERDGDRAATATMLNYLASVHCRRSRNDEAVPLLQRCIEICRELGDRDGLGRAMANLAMVHHESGRWAESIEVALGVRRLGRARHNHNELNALANGYQRIGDEREALRYHRLRLMAQWEIRDLARIGDSLVNIAVLKHRLGLVDVAAAIRQMRVSRRLIQRAGYPHGQAETEHELALLLAADGQLTEAVAGHWRAIEFAEQAHNREQESRFCHGLGRTYRLSGDDVAARAMFERSLRLGRQARMPYRIALAQAALGDCLTAGDPDEARRLLGLARAGLAALGAPELRDVEKLLAQVGGEDHLRSGSGGETIRA